VGRASAQPWKRLTGPQYEKKARESWLKMAILIILKTSGEKISTKLCNKKK